MTSTLEVVAESLVGRVVPGFSAHLVDADETLGAASFGLADRRSETVMTTDSVCNWFSMTKLVTATAAVQLADRNRLDLDAPVGQYYAPFSAMRPEGRAERTTVRHLLSHSSGVANPFPLRWVHRATDAGPRREAFVETLVAKHRRLRFDPGSRAAYTNLGYLVLGEVVAAAAGQPFEEYVRANVLQPLNMTRTDFVAFDESTWATPYQKRRTALSAFLPLLIPRTIIGPKDDRFVALRHFYVDGAAYGGLVGPPSDAARFVRAHLRGGELDGTRVLSEESCREMQTIISRGRGLEVGLGWFRRGRQPATDFVEHLGGGAGFWNCMRIYPERGLGVVVMGNATSHDHDAVVRAAVAGVRHEGACQDGPHDS